ncbi:hypothetical protein [Aquamicrobium terrae]|uniref:DUF3606 domain-containing protein n=1 Tax=Aquamicrobium terrae TaxID=1324945 RepID=A0ABV2MV73_9HYPH
MSPAPEFITIELARLTRAEGQWARRFRDYELLLTAGLSCEEAAQIVTDLAREAESQRELEAV